MKIVVTGASGFVGTMLVPRLAASGAELLLCGRDLEKLRHLYPDRPICDYAALPQAARGFDHLVNLACANNHAGLTEAEAFAANVALPLELAEVAKKAGIAHFIHFSSTHALASRPAGPYAATKKQADLALAALHDPAVKIIHLPPVYGERWAGRLSVLNRLPLGVARLLFTFLAAYSPTVHVDRLMATIVNPPADSPIIVSDNQDENPVFTCVKRGIDLGFALFVLIGLSWLLVLIVIIVKCESRGGALLRQRRMGKGRREFTCYKFRTMVVGTPNLATHEVPKAAITRVGGFLRRTKLDELPQAFNILVNDMSLIGPRPCLPVQHELIAERSARNVFSIKPGISGLAQVHNIDMKAPKRLAVCDARYLALRSLVLDVKIIIATLFKRFDIGLAP